MNAKELGGTLPTWGALFKCACLPREEPSTGALLILGALTTRALVTFIMTKLDAQEGAQKARLSLFPTLGEPNRNCWRY